MKRGKGQIPVADYSLAAQALPDYAQVSSQTASDASATGRPQAASPDPAGPVSSASQSSVSGQKVHTRQDNDDARRTSGDGTSTSGEASQSQHRGHEGPHSRIRSQRYKQGHRSRASSSNQEGQRAVYSFCMCPGGQIVPTSTNPEELCINGMSFRCAP